MTASERGSQRILVVEDDHELRLFLLGQLRAEGATAIAVDNGPEAVATVLRTELDVVLLDLDLPGLDGLGVLSQVRRVSNVAVIIVTGRRSEADRVMGLDLGADDYLVKPFSVRELHARIRAVTRRTVRPGDHDSGVIAIEGLHIDPERREVTSAGEPVVLTRREFDLLHFLARHRGRVFSREELLAAVWGSSGEWQQVSTVTEHVRRIRAKIQIDPQGPEYIAAVRTIGYSFTPKAHDVGGPARPTDRGARSGKSGQPRRGPVA